jgi:hypothetical protein
MTLLLLILAAPPLALMILWIASKRRKPYLTTAEQLVRCLFTLARWMEAIARAAESAGICYREHIATTPISERLERFRPREDQQPERRPLETRLRKWEP